MTFKERITSIKHALDQIDSEIGIVTTGSIIARIADINAELNEIEMTLAGFLGSGPAVSAIIVPGAISDKPGVV